MNHFLVLLKYLFIVNFNYKLERLRKSYLICNPKLIDNMKFT